MAFRFNDSKLYKQVVMASPWRVLNLQWRDVTPPGTSGQKVWNADVQGNVEHALKLRLRRTMPAFSLTRGGNVQSSEGVIFAVNPTSCHIQARFFYHRSGVKCGCEFKARGRRQLSTLPESIILDRNGSDFKFAAHGGLEVQYVFGGG